jgi:dienelactone hydrolase
MQGSVTFYATRINEQRLSAVRTPLLMLFAGADDVVPPAAVSKYERIANKLCSQGTFSKVSVFENEPHGFAHVDGRGSSAAKDAAQQEAFSFLASQAVL